MRRWAIGATAALAFGGIGGALAACRSEPSSAALRVIELYTSQGCDSCPPADRWLAALPDDGRSVRLAWHVDYWDRLGWKDPFAQAAFSQRQREQLAINGSGFPYTPQVVIDSRDRRDWRQWPQGVGPSGVAAQMTIQLEREGDAVLARLQPLAGSARRLAGFWAITEGGHATAVKAGENAGALLRNDHVVRHWQPLPAFDAGERTLRLAVPRAEGGRTRRVVLVLTDAASGRTVQAAQLGC